MSTPVAAPQERTGRSIIVDWGTSRFRAYIVEEGTIVDRYVSEEGISALKKGDRQNVFRRRCGPRRSRAHVPWPQRGVADRLLAVTAKRSSPSGIHLAPQAGATCRRVPA